MNRFLDNANRIFEAAESASSAGHNLSDMAILIGTDGGIRMVAESDWPLESLQYQHGAQMAFRVSQRHASVRLEGRSGGSTCVLQTVQPAQAARVLLGAQPHYEVIPDRKLLTA